MFGWEFPPYSSGGLGTACYGLTKGLSKIGVQVTLVLPRADTESDIIKIISAKIKVIRKKSILTPYISSEQYMKRYRKMPDPVYGSSLFQEVYRYSEIAKEIAMEEDFDVIHCHDWMTYKAGINAKEISNKPLIIHVHATEFDRTGDNPNQAIYDFEREGMHKADEIIAVSNLTKNKIVEHYGINPDKVTVVHNAIEPADYKSLEEYGIKKDSKIVLFLGRITIQKGPEYFLYAAKKVLEHEPNVRFIIAGSGDMESFIIEKAAELGIADKVLFAGLLKGDDVHKAYKMADLYVMPSISEPFGLTALESMIAGTPVIISKQSGVSEVIKHCLKVDFWDINELANKIIAVLRYPPLNESLEHEGRQEAIKFDWTVPAEKCLDVYKKAIFGPPLIEEHKIEEYVIKKIEPIEVKKKTRKRKYKRKKQTKKSKHYKKTKRKRKKVIRRKRKKVKKW